VGGEAVIVRPATRGDLSVLLNECRAHHNERGLDFPFDQIRISITLIHAITAPDWLCLTGPRCILVASYFDSLFGAGRLAIEHLYRADHPRESEVLRSEYEAWARRNGCLKATLSSTWAHDAHERLYRRDGYLKAETVFAKTL
jgi:hypothetical protein